MIRETIETLSKGTLRKVNGQGERIILHENGQDIAAVVSLQDLAFLESLEDRMDLEEALRVLQDENDPVKDFFGKVNLGFSTGVDNEQIDADLVKEYDSIHAKTNID